MDDVRRYRRAGPTLIGPTGMTTPITPVSDAELNKLLTATAIHEDAQTQEPVDFKSLLIKFVAYIIDETGNSMLPPSYADHIAKDHNWKAIPFTEDDVIALMNVKKHSDILLEAVNLARKSQTTGRL